MKDFTLLCPNEREARIAMQDKETGIEILSQKLINITKSENLIMKSGSNGFIVYERNGVKFNSQSFPALSVNPVDVTGAGDTLLSIMAVGIASGNSVMVSSAIACCACKIAVQTMGNNPISPILLKTQIRNLLKDL